MALASQLRKCTLPDVVGIINIFFARLIMHPKWRVLLGFRQPDVEGFFRTPLGGKTDHEAQAGCRSLRDAWAGRLSRPLAPLDVARTYNVDPTTIGRLQ